jgi:hypothetical protein
MPGQYFVGDYDDGVRDARAWLQTGSSHIVFLYHDLPFIWQRRGTLLLCRPSTSTGPPASRSMVSLRLPTGTSLASFPVPLPLRGLRCARLPLGQCPG